MFKRQMFAAIGGMFFAAATPLHAVSISEVGGGANPGLFTLSDASGGGAGGLSGLTFDPIANKYYVVDDSDTRIYPANLSINTLTGAILSGSIDAALQLRDGGGTALTSRDHEGIAFNPTNQSVWVSNEGDPSAPASSYAPTITEHRLSDGHQIDSLTLPSVYTNQTTNGVRINKSLESLSRNNAGTIWTANEEALNDDGDISGVGTGTTVRLTRFNSSGIANGQFAYQTDGGLSAISGVSDLLVLPDGTLIVLERAVSLGFRIRLYEVDLTSATDVSGTSALTGAETLANKSLLWEGLFSSELGSAQTNFEGLSLGPALTDGSGDFSLVLVADNDGSTVATNHNFYALRISNIPEPATAILIAMSTLGLNLRRKR